MKNIFKLLGIAMLACGMMVACGEEEVVPEDTTPTDTTPVPPPAPQNTIDIVWNGDNATIGFRYMSVDNSRLDGATVYCLEAAAGLDGDDYVFPAFIFQFIGTGNEVAHASHYNITVNDTTTYNGNVIFPTEVYNEGGVEVEYSNGTTGIIGDYQFMQLLSENFNFNATAVTVSGSISMYMFDYAPYAENYARYQAGEIEQSQILDGVDTPILALTLGNYSFQASK